MHKLLRGISELVITIGVVLALFVVYEVWVTDLFAHQRQDQVAHELREGWRGSPPATDAAPRPIHPRLGEPLAFLHIPRFGSDWTRAVVEGVDPAELRNAPGHYPGTALPGQVGNFAMAGHRVGTGSPFLDNDKLEPGDAVVVETEDYWYVYRVVKSEIVPPTRTDVVAAPPPGLTPGSWLTMTTCNPKFSARERLVVHARLQSAVSKSRAPDGPSALREVT